MTAVKCVMPAPSLGNNLVGDPAELSIEILLPSDYPTPGRRYPSIYVLAGMSDDASYMVCQLGHGLKVAPAPEAEAQFAPLLDLRNWLAGKSAADRRALFVREGTGSFDVAYGAAFVPDPTSPIFTKLPYESQGGKLVLDQATWKLWEPASAVLPRSCPPTGEPQAAPGDRHRLRHL
ncbi:MAG TPA: hypothetical protein VF337_05790 [Candidatus Limnocylindrales bacterium]